MPDGVRIHIDGDTSGFQRALGETEDSARSLGDRLRGAGRSGDAFFSGMLKSQLVMKGLSLIGSGLTSLARTAVSATASIIGSYGEYEQLVGGVETLFKDAAGTVMKYADDAYKTAGLSANEYMDTVTAFSASLIQSVGGDTQKAAEYADMAITDMSDNANKMGSDMSSIQNAYQGFAKQNYTINYLMSAA